ncbi:MAG: SUMF1/EgtB/PvdO family nonheme iron enzyme [Bacteroidales bacterium]|jgi:gliding motility-associated lipoprotein GldK|nr:SUMF1/EgtB/PvdO family nonheme iron enzyme [Bacteroidales bacterium]
MKKIAFAMIVVSVVLTACSNKGDGQLVGVKDRPKMLETEPFGMVFVPEGYYMMGAGEQDVPYAYTNQSKPVTIRPFWMDETEITNNEYRQFVNWVRDSLAHVLLGEADISEEGDKGGHYLKYEKGESIGEVIEPKLINWNEKIPWDSDNEEVQAALSPLYTKISTRFYHYRGPRTNTSMFNYEYWDFDYRNYRDPKNPEIFGAATKEFDKEGYEYGGLYANRPSSLGQGAERFIRHEVVNIYPDTLCWAHDFAYSFNEDMLENYFNNVKFDNYPVVGVNWVQAKAFIHWRTFLRNAWLASKGHPQEMRFRLPNEAEWEYAARGGMSLNPYPHGGPYATNAKGCFLLNFKPQRGNYRADGHTYPAIVAHYHPNDYGLFDMAGNVSEWCEDAYDKSSVNFTHDLNPQYRYYAQKDDHSSKKRKVIRGGSWKDISYYCNVSTKAFEYQDTCASFIGFRCVQSYMGHDREDAYKTESHVY